MCAISLWLFFCNHPQTIAQHTTGRYLGSLKMCFAAAADLISMRTGEKTGRERLAYKLESVFVIAPLEEFNHVILCLVPSLK